jgi:Tfp pilus assembly protein PilX
MRTSAVTDLTRSNERGIALVFTLFLMASLSALAVSLMFLSQTETSATRNYRTMSQARYAGEAGVHKAINFLINSYPVPSVATLSSYDLTVSPVKYNGAAVVLSAMTGVSSNYPDSTVITNFNTAAQGTLNVNVPINATTTVSATVRYGAYATLLAMRQTNVYGSTTSVVQTWQITADGTVPGTMPATVEVTGMLERQIVPAETYGVFATGTGCGAITLSGNASTDSYDSTNVAAGTTPSGGNVGTNGNLSINGTVDVHGSLSTPRTGVGACSEGSVNALSESGSANVSSGTIQLPQAITFTTPDLPATLPPMTTMNNAASICAAVSLPALCVTIGSNTTITPNGATISLGNVSMTGGTLTLNGGSYNINSLSLTGNAVLAVGSGNTVMNVVGRTSTGYNMATPMDLGGGSVSNASLDPARLQILYAGTGEIKTGGGSAFSGMVYAPNAAVSTHGNAEFYGSILSATVTDAGNTNFHYDRHLQSQFFTLGKYVMTSFSWKKY